jgi:hypothetical protein
MMNDRRKQIDRIFLFFVCLVVLVVISAKVYRMIRPYIWECCVVLDCLFILREYTRYNIREYP